MAQMKYKLVAQMKYPKFQKLAQMQYAQFKYKQKKRQVRCFHPRLPV